MQKGRQLAVRVRAASWLYIHQDRPCNIHQGAVYLEPMQRIHQSRQPAVTPFLDDVRHAREARRCDDGQDLDRAPTRAVKQGLLCGFWTGFPRPPSDKSVDRV